MTISYLTAVDWNHDGDYSDSGEDVSARVRATPGIAIEKGKDQIRALSPPMAGICSYDLDNQSRDYSIENAAGPLFGNLKTGRRGKVVPTLSQTQVITPSLGSELVLNPGFETAGAGGGDVFTSWWAEANGGVITQDAVTFHGGTKSAKLVSGPAIDTKVTQDITVTPERLYQLDGWSYANGANVPKIFVFDSAWSLLVERTLSNAAAWAEMLHTFRNPAGNTTIHLMVHAPYVNADLAYFDDTSLKLLTLSASLGTLIVGPTHGTWTCHPTLTAKTWAGMVVNWDGLSDGTQDFVLAYHDGTNAALLKCVAGVYTNVVAPTAAAYSAAAELKVIRHMGTNTYELWYNGAQVGSDATISDVSVISNKGYAGFSTYASNTCGAITATDGEYSLFTGFLTNLKPQPARSNRSASVSFLDALTKLQAVTIYTELYSDIRTDQAVGYVLDAFAAAIDEAGDTSGTGDKWGTGTWDSVTLGSFGFSTTERVFDTGQTTLAWWWVNGETAYDALMKILATEGPGAALYIDGEGRLHFESRQYRMLTTRSNTSQASFSEVSTSEPAFSDFEYDARITDVINAAIATVKTRAAATALSVVWSSPEYFTIGASEVRRVLASATDPFQNAVVPMPGVDFTVVSGSVSVGLSRSSGGATEIILTGGASGASITGLQLRALSVPVTLTQIIKSTISATTSQAEQGESEPPETLSMLEDIDPNVAMDIVNAYVYMYKTPRTQIYLGIEGANDTRLMHQIGREISDRITVAETQTGLNGDLWIERIAHQIDHGGRFHKTIFGCEKVVAFPSTDLWGSSTWDSFVLGF